MAFDDAADPIAEFQARALRRLDLLATFDAGDYQALNPDLAHVDPRRHYVENGVWELRQAISDERRTARLGRAISLAPVGPLDQARMQRGYRGVAAVSPTIHLPPRSTEGEHATAQRIMIALDSVGMGGEVSEAPPSVADRAPILVNPAALWPAGTPREQMLAALRRCLVFLPEAPASSLFGAVTPYLLASAGVLAAEVETFALAREIGLPAVWFGQAPVTHDTAAASDYPLFAGLSRAVREAPADLPWDKRPIDIVSLEPHSASRSAAWTRMSVGVSGLSHVIQASPADMPIPPAVRTFLYQRSKLVLHLHEASATTLPMELAAEAAAAGAAVVSEPSPSNGLLRAEADFFSSSARRMVDRVRTLVGTEAGAAAAQAAAASIRATLGGAFAPETLGLQLVNALLDRSEAP